MKIIEIAFHVSSVYVLVSIVVVLLSELLKNNKNKPIVSNKPIVNFIIAFVVWFIFFIVGM